MLGAKAEVNREARPGATAAGRIDDSECMAADRKERNLHINRAIHIDAALDLRQRPRSD